MSKYTFVAGMQIITESKGLQKLPTCSVSQDHNGQFQKISIHHDGRLQYLTPPCLRKFQNALPPHALRIP